jgi:DNA-binding NarL/FixJ family response regulator
VRTQKIIIADSNKFFREGLKTILMNIGRVKIVGEAECGNDLLSLMDSQKADIVFVEVNMPKMNGIEVTRKAHIKFPDTTFIAFSSLENKRYIDQMLEAGAEGYLSKNCNNYDLFRQIIEDRHHGGFISPELLTRQMTDININ